MVILPFVVVDPGRAPELDSQYHQRLVQQPLGLEVCEQGAHRLVQDRGLPMSPLEVVAVRDIRSVDISSLFSKLKTIRV